MNKSVVLRLASPDGEAKLRRIVESLNKPVGGIDLSTGDNIKSNMLDEVTMGDTPLRLIFDVIYGTDARFKAKRVPQ